MNQVPALGAIPTLFVVHIFGSKWPCSVALEAMAEIM